ncbi:MAG: hypothetical protein HY318_04625 [Armatimonadetes bacterium]|nr:hypothetical protein [Armatimonadota bacterium]
MENAQSSILALSFLFKARYVGETRSKQFREALKAAALRGVKALVVLIYSLFEPDVAAENWATAQDQRSRVLPVNHSSTVTLRA